MHFSPSRVFSRVDRFKRDRVDKFIQVALTSKIVISKYEVPGEPVQVSNILKKLSSKAFKPFKIGSPYGKVWGTTWFLIEGKISPSDYKTAKNIEFLLDLGWSPSSPGLHTEALAYTIKGVPFKALHPQNDWLRLKGVGSPVGKNRVLQTNGQFTFLIEAASNPLLLGDIAFAPTPYGESIMEVENQKYQINRANIASFNDELFKYSVDLEVLVSLARTLPETSPRAVKIAFALENSMNKFDENNLSTLVKARYILKTELIKPANASAGIFNAVGHAHIDSAWLWPIRETKRKVARTLSNVFALLRIYPDWIYTMSSAQQFVWLEENYPDLFVELKYWVNKGRIVPIGGQWVEADGVLPNGESLVRQIIYGKNYFAKTFGQNIETIWLPDSFGYSGSYPGIARRAGFKYFLTQKISWSDSTKFPHNSFYWQGIDGTRILTHFPPTDTYNGQMTADELNYGCKNYKEQAISDNQIYLYGNGDGGGGPTRQMIAKAEVFNNLEGVPRVEHTNPNRFYRKLANELNKVGGWVPTWSGELYLEFHRGTLTSQHRIKKANRQTESLLRLAELVCVSKTLAKTKYAYPDEKLDNIWQNLLLNQFHDILPGTAIAWVVDQTVKELNWSCSQLRTLIKDTLNRVDQPFINKVKLTKSARAYELFNDNCRIKIDKLGYISSYEIKTSNNFEQLIPKGQKFAVLQLLDDKPIQWDTWDIDKSAFHAIKEFIKPDKTVVNSNGVTFDFKSDKSLFSLTISLNNQSSGPELDIRVDWAEEEKLLKLALPLDLAANITKAETQYGLIERPVYNNLLADDAKFETSMQRFVFIENNDLQIGVVNNGLYGFDSTPIVGGGTQLRPTILKSSKYPDPRSEKNKYSDFKISLVAGQRNNNNSVLDMILDKANQLNNEFIFDYSQFLEIDNLQGKLVLDWIKLADDKSGDIIARFYEPYGARAKSNIKLSKLLQNYKVKEVDLLETDNLPNDIYKSYKAKNDNILVLETQPFYLVTLRFSK